MPQLELWPDDDLFADAGKKVGPTITPAEEAILRAFEVEKGIVKMTTPEDRQRYFAQVAADERRAARNSRTPKSTPR